MKFVTKSVAKRMSLRHENATSTEADRILACAGLTRRAVLLLQGLQTCTFVLIMELFTAQHRTLVGTVFEVFWGTGVLWLATAGFLLQNWRHIQLLITLPSVLAVVYIW